jgi:hypothetical protein
VLEEARELLLRVLSTLDDPVWEKHSIAGQPIGLARAQALTLLDHLVRIADSEVNAAASQVVAD